MTVLGATRAARAGFVAGRTQDSEIFRPLGTGNTTVPRLIITCDGLDMHAGANRETEKSVPGR